MLDFVRVAEVADLRPGVGLEVTVDDRVIALFQIDGVVHAIDNVCVHRGGPLAQGALDGYTVLCPWHAWGYDLRTGACDVNPNARMTIYDVRIEAGAVFVRARA